MSIEVRCPCCKRVERWESVPAPRRVSVRAAGGHRRPAEAPAIAAWRTLTTLRGGEVAFGACEACGQPLVARELPTRAYAVPISSALTFDADGFHGANGPLDAEAARRLVVAESPAEARPGAMQYGFTGFALGLVGLLAVGFVLAWSYIAYLGYRIATGEVFTP